MSLVKTLDEWIRELEKSREYMGGNKLIVGNLYSADGIHYDIDYGIGEDGPDEPGREAARLLDSLSERKLLELFVAGYDLDEATAHSNAMSYVRKWMYAASCKAKQDKEERK